MDNLQLYRKIVLTALAVMTAVFLLSMGALWNFYLSQGSKGAGWVILFTSLVYVCGMLMFFVAHKFSDQKLLDLALGENARQERDNLLREIKIKERENLAGEFQEEKDEEKTLRMVMQNMQQIGKADELCRKLLGKLSKHLEIVQGIIYLQDDNQEKYKPCSSYALTGEEPEAFETGEGLPGQAVQSKKTIKIFDIPEDYFNVASGLGDSKPAHLLFVPVLSRDECLALIEISFFKKPGERTLRIINNVATATGEMLYELKRI